MTAEWVAYELDDEDDITAALRPGDFEDSVRFFTAVAIAAVPSLAFWALMGVAVWRIWAVWPR